MQVATKNKTAKSVEWRVPGIMGGNTVPGWEDQQGSIVRRVVLWLYNTQVREVDTTLPARLKEEMPTILLKANRAYLWAVGHVGSRSIWSVLPEYFLKTREQMAEATNSMRGFLGSEAVTYDPDAYCPLNEVRAAWKKWALEQNISPIPKWVPDVYMAPLEARGCRVGSELLAYPRFGCGSRSRRLYVRGLDLAANVQEHDENADPNIQ